MTYLKLSTAPTLSVSYPECSACGVETEHDGDVFTCPSCGTLWQEGNDGEEGTLYEDWSGEKLDGLAIDPWDAYMECLRRRISSKNEETEK